MIHHLSRLARHSVVYGLAETISRGTGFVLMFIYLRLLTDAEIGIRTLLYVGSSFIILFYTLGLDQAFLRYFMDEELKERKREIFTTSVVFTVFLGIVFLILALFRGSLISALMTESESYVYATCLLFVIMIFDTLSLYPMQVLRAEDRFRYYLFISAERLILFILFNLLFVGGFRRGVNGIFEANLLVVIIVVASLVPIYVRNLGRQISTSLLRRMLMFGIPTVFTVFAMRIIDLSDRRILQFFLGESEVGQYAAAYTLGMVGIMVFVNSFRIAWQPFFLSLQSRPEAKSVFAQVATFYSLFISFAFLGITLFREEIFMIYAPGRPLWLSAIIPLVALSYILYGFYIVLLPGVFIREKTSALLVASCVGAVCNVALNFAFIPVFGIIGAAYATIAAYGVMVAVLFFMSRRFYHISYEFSRIAVVWIVTAVPVALSFMIHPASRVAGVAVNLLLLTVPLILYQLIGFWREDERRFFLSLFRGNSMP
ncbi:lipopolysaccharide biosynthesis protein [Candidatus Latescibacterota bacterium]